MKLPTIPWHSEVTRGVLIAAILAVAGAIIGVLLIPASPRSVDASAPAPNFVLLGQRIPATADAAERALQLVRRYASSPIVLKMPDGKQHSIARSEFGAEVQRVRLARLIDEASDPASSLRKYLSGSGAHTDVTLPVPVVLNTERAIATLLQLKDRVDRPALDARLDLQTRKLLPEQTGIAVDVHGTLARLREAVRTGEREVELVVEHVQPRLRAEQLGNVTFDHVLGYFETNYARGQRNALRTYNLRLAASKLDGYVLLPGEEFDFNTVVGPRDEAHGYKQAPVIAEGELVDGIGGGTCQIAGTLHGAAFFAGLEVLSRRPHTRPSSYIKMGLDAAVSYPTISLRLKNGFDFPVVLHETVKDGVVRAEILGPKRTITVTYVRKILKVTPYEQIERQDANLPAGVRVLSQRGIPGFKIQRHRIVRDGPYAERQKSIDVYPPTAQIVRVGTGTMAPDTVEVSDDPHPEYTADEYLVVTQGPGIRTRQAGDDPGGPMVERRVPGWTGQRGWTEKAGFPFYRSEREACSGDDCKSASKKKGSKGNGAKASGSKKSEPKQQGDKASAGKAKKKKG